MSCDSTDTCDSVLPPQPLSPAAIELQAVQLDGYKRQSKSLQVRPAVSGGLAVCLHRGATPVARGLLTTDAESTRLEMGPSWCMRLLGPLLGVVVPRVEACVVGSDSHGHLLVSGKAWQLPYRPLDATAGILHRARFSRCSHRSGVRFVRRGRIGMHQIVQFDGPFGADGASRGVVHLRNVPLTLLLQVTAGIAPPI